MLLLCGRSPFFYMASFLVIIGVSLLASMDQAQQQQREQNGFITGNNRLFLYQHVVQRIPKTKSWFTSSQANTSSHNSHELYYGGHEEVLHFPNQTFSCQPRNPSDSSASKSKPKQPSAQTRQPVFIISAPSMGSFGYLEALEALCQASTQSFCSTWTRLDNFLSHRSHTRPLLQMYQALQHHCNRGVPPRDTTTVETTLQVPYQWRQVRRSPQFAWTFLQQQAELAQAQELQHQFSFNQPLENHPSYYPPPLPTWLPLYAKRHAQPLSALSFWTHLPLVPEVDKKRDKKRKMKFSNLLAVQLFLDPLEQPQLWVNRAADESLVDDDTSNDAIVNATTTTSWPFLQELVRQYPNATFVVVWRRNLGQAYKERQEALGLQGARRRESDKVRPQEHVFRVNVTLDEYVAAQQLYWTSVRQILPPRSMRVVEYERDLVQKPATSIPTWFKQVVWPEAVLSNQTMVQVLARIQKKMRKNKKAAPRDEQSHFWFSSVASSDRKKKNKNKNKKKADESWPDLWA